MPEADDVIALVIAKAKQRNKNVNILALADTAKETDCILVEIAKNIFSLLLADESKFPPFVCIVHNAAPALCLKGASSSH
jgi:hypothetical protein